MIIAEKNKQTNTFKLFSYIYEQEYKRAKDVVLILE